MVFFWGGGMGGGKTPLKATFWSRLQSIFRLVAAGANARDYEVWGIDNITC